MFMRHIFAELAKGNRKLFVEAMAAAFCWMITGSTAWRPHARQNGFSTS